MNQRDVESAINLWVMTVAIVEPDIAQDGLFKLFAQAEMMALQHVLDASVEAFDHAVGLEPHRRSEAMLDAQFGAKSVELVRAGGRAGAQAEHSVGELLAVIGEDPHDLHRRGALQTTQEAAHVSRRLRRVNAHEDPARGAVDGDEQITAAFLVGHLRQELHVDMHIARFVIFERLARVWPPPA